MIHERSRLGRALALSLVLHAAVIGAVAQLVALPGPRRALPDLTVTLREPELAPEKPAPAPPQLLLPQETTSRNRSAARPAVAQPVPSLSAPRLSGEAALRAAEQLQRELLYPREAIERGLQGEALVLLFLDQAGNAVAARIESSSGHVLLDDAAVRAARTLRALPDSAPRDVLLEVRFRLR
jgi:protein TonB